jgi:hypothetical protein
VAFKVLQFFPSILFAEQLNTAMNYEVAVIGSHSCSINDGSFWYSYRDDPFSDFVDKGFDLYKLGYVVKVESFLIPWLFLFGVGVGCHAMIFDHLFHKVDEILIRL